MRNCSIGDLMHLKKGNAAKVRFNVFFGLAGDLHLEIKLVLNSHFICFLGKVCYFHNFLICFSLKKEWMDSLCHSDMFKYSVLLAAFIQESSLLRNY